VHPRLLELNNLSSTEEVAIMQTSTLRFFGSIIIGLFVFGFSTHGSSARDTSIACKPFLCLFDRDCKDGVCKSGLCASGTKRRGRSEDLGPARLSLAVVSRKFRVGGCLLDAFALHRGSEYN
jgi:hypothetical protein